jgi:hypothetical protein
MGTDQRAERREEETGNRTPPADDARRTACSGCSVPPFTPALSNTYFRFRKMTHMQA